MATTANGTTFRFKLPGGAKTAVGRLTSIGRLAPDSEAVDVTTLDSAGGWRESMQGFRDAGELELAGFHDKDDGGQALLRTAYLSGQVGECEIEFTDGCKAAFSAFVKSTTIGSAEVDGAVGFGATLRVTGAVTVTTSGEAPK